MAHCTLLKLVFIKGIHKEQKYFWLHQRGGERPRNCKMCMKITFHSKTPKRVERKRVGRAATKKQSSISFYYPFNLDHPPRYPQLDYRIKLPRAKTGPRGCRCCSSSHPQPSKRTPTGRLCPKTARDGAEVPLSCRHSRGMSLPAHSAPRSGGGGEAAPRPLGPGSGLRPPPRAARGAHCSPPPARGSGLRRGGSGAAPPHLGLPLSPFFFLR